jgi:DNA-binding transcriptional regulator YhcF (GntR family)
MWTRTYPRLRLQLLPDLWVVKVQLKDIERKVLTIIHNFYHTHRRLPTVKELCIWTGRNEVGIKQVLKSLTEKSCIEWEPKSGTIVLVEEWGREEKKEVDLKFLR